MEATFDAIAVHPYSPTLAGVKEQMVRARAAARQAGDGEVSIWVTELGWASAGPRSQGLVKTPKAQARLLDESFRYLLAKRKAWNLRGITWYSWRDAASALHGLRVVSAAPACAPWPAGRSRPAQRSASSP